MGEPGICFRKVSVQCVLTLSDCSFDRPLAEEREPFFYTGQEVLFHDRSRCRPTICAVRRPNIPRDALPAMLRFACTLVALPQRIGCRCSTSSQFGWKMNLARRRNATQACRTHSCVCFDGVHWRSKATCRFYVTFSTRREDRLVTFSLAGGT